MGSLFSSPKAPVIPTPVVMPTENTAAVQEAQRQAAMAATAATGRRSTILMQNQQGGQATKLGG